MMEFVRIARSERMAAVVCYAKIVWILASAINALFSFVSVLGSKKLPDCWRKYCNKTSCKEQLNRCGACRKSFCFGCQEVEHCDECDAEFCKSHNHMVDCAECKIRHCRECGYDNRCIFCSQRCFVDCVFDERKQRPSEQSFRKVLCIVHLRRSCW